MFGRKKQKPPTQLDLFDLEVAQIMQTRRMKTEHLYRYEYGIPPEIIKQDLAVADTQESWRSITWGACSEYLDQRRAAYEINDRLNETVPKVEAIIARRARRERSLYRQKFRSSHYVAAS